MCLSECGYQFHVNQKYSPRFFCVCGEDEVKESSIILRNNKLHRELLNSRVTWLIFVVWFRSDQISRSVVSDSLPTHESQHARPPCPSPTPGVHWDSRPLSQWCHPAISSSVIPVSFCPQSLPASESFPMSQLCAWGGQSIGVSASGRRETLVSLAFCRGP